MKKIFTLAALGLFAATPLIAREPTVTPDFVPTSKIYGQEMTNLNIHIAGIPADTTLSQIVIELTFPDEMYGFGKGWQYIKVYNEAGEEFPPMKTETMSPTDNTKLCRVTLTGYDKYNHDLNLTCKIPEGIFGDKGWSQQAMVQRVNPALEYKFNVWELLGKQRPNNTKYDLEPTVNQGEAGVIRVNGKQTDAVLYKLTFEEDIFLNDKYHQRCSLYGIGMGEEIIDPATGKPTGEKYDKSLGDDCILFEVNKDNPKQIDVQLTGIEIDKSNKYKLNIWQGCMGNKLWSEEEYSEGRANPDTFIEFDPTTLPEVGVESIITDAEGVDAPVYNLQGIRVNKNQLPAGIYVQSGKKFVVR